MVEIKVKIKKGCRLVCKRPKNSQSFATEKRKGLCPNGLYELDSWDTQHYYLRAVMNSKLSDDLIQIDRLGGKKKTFNALFYYFVLGWGMTCYTVQGQSISENICIHEAKMMQQNDASLLYTAVSRATDYKYLHIGEKYKGDGIVASIYECKNKTTGMTYIGQTTYVNWLDRVKNHYTDMRKTTCKFHKMLLATKQCYTEWTLLHSGLFPSHEAINQAEANHIRENNSIEFGYNERLPYGYTK
jgi:hypothetical protein